MLKYLDAILKPELVVGERNVELSFEKSAQCRQRLRNVHVLYDHRLALTLKISHILSNIQTCTLLVRNHINILITCLFTDMRQIKTEFIKLVRQWYAHHQFNGLKAVTVS